MSNQEWDPAWREEDCCICWGEGVVTFEVEVAPGVVREDETECVCVRGGR